MELEILPLEEGTDIDMNGRFYRYKRARFKVDGAEHTIRISMKDFQEGRTREIIEQEARKIAAVREGVKRK
ncbi:MAG: hypothetical protein DRJ99_03245 [Thermoplasmata archaeon]|nr:MAG: hypothetical protein DRJ99_03245 [Thermoplasmata archaeon]